MSQVEKLFCNLDNNGRLDVSWASQVPLPKNLPASAGWTKGSLLVEPWAP